MKFRTEIERTELSAKIGYDSRILALGSCFAENIAARMAEAKFRVESNPTGILFNPLSIAAAVGSLGKEVRREELHTDGDLWFHFGFHGDFSAPTADEALERMNAARIRGCQALADADRVILTLGTAWVYEREGRVVANCHRRPSAEFVRRRLSVGEIVETLGSLFEGAMRGKAVILTVSPVRHLGDGLVGNSVSKATLRLACEELAERYAGVEYFPSYELLVDDLRDYRFYDDDMVHPATQAVDYIWAHFMDAAMTEHTRRLVSEVMQIVRAASHRPRNPHGEAHLAFCRRQLERIAALPEIDFRKEEALFRQSMEIFL